MKELDKVIPKVIILYFKNDLDFINRKEVRWTILDYSWIISLTEEFYKKVRFRCL